ncbi:hypothetical protein JTB14_002807 [Gonioctena quinquepunctata]|nr:hypothetical protein JTB14_002807 [Gonioctena quinquepunctata]
MSWAIVNNDIIENNRRDQATFSNNREESWVDLSMSHRHNLVESGRKRTAQRPLVYKIQHRNYDEKTNIKKLKDLRHRRGKFEKVPKQYEYDDKEKIGIQATKQQKTCIAACEQSMEIKKNTEEKQTMVESGIGENTKGNKQKKKRKVRNTIRDLQNSKAIAEDGTQNEATKYIEEILGKKMTSLYNKCPKGGKFPKIWWIPKQSHKGRYHYYQCWGKYWID